MHAGEVALLVMLAMVYIWGQQQSASEYELPRSNDARRYTFLPCLQTSQIQLVNHCVKGNAGLDNFGLIQADFSYVTFYVVLCVFWFF